MRAAYHLDKQIQKVTAAHVLHDKVEIVLVLETMEQTNDGRRVGGSGKKVALSTYVS